MSGDVLRTIAAVTHREQALDAGRPRYPGDVTGAPDKLGAIDAAAAAFRDAGLAYALIGGVAVGIRSGVPRATLDVDFAVSTTTDLGAATAALEARGFRRTGVFAHSMNFVHASGEPLQLAFDPLFDPMIARAEPVRFGALELVVVTREDLIAMKRRAAADPARRRSKALRDQADIALLEGDVPGPDDGW
ncbi:MAG TPA: nucleotidyl transferase AbiEii/AbiGii toxin family protein [Polyangiaceae bacterium]